MMRCRDLRQLSKRLSTHSSSSSKNIPSIRFSQNSGFCRQQSYNYSQKIVSLNTSAILIHRSMFIRSLSSSNGSGSNEKSGDNNKRSNDGMDVSKNGENPADKEINAVNTPLGDKIVDITNHANTNSNNTTSPLSSVKLDHTPKDNSTNNSSNLNMNTNYASNTASTTPTAATHAQHLQHEAHRKGLLSQANQNISATLHYAGQSIEEVEKMLMKRLNENNKRRFRMYFFGSLSMLVILMYVFGNDIRKMVSAQTADLAKETLENESLQVQTQQLAMAVVQTILNDQEVTAMAASFLREASTAKETQLALLDLVTHVLQHPNSLDELTQLSLKLIQALSQNPEVHQRLVTLCNQILTDPQFLGVLVQVLQQLFQHPEVVSAMMVCFAEVFKAPEVAQAATQMVQSATQELLADEQVLEESRRFIADVMGDDSLQKEGGDALWNSLNYAVKPGFIKITGVMLIGLSIGAFRLFISPF